LPFRRFVEVAAGLYLTGGAAKRGEQTGMFRPGMDALQLYVSISALCFFTFSNTYTLSAVFGRDLMKPEALAERRRHVIDFVLAALCRATGQV
jgi:TetR/AcrR family transcriptional regulator